MVVFQLRKKVTASGKLSRANCDGKMNTLPQIQGVSNCRATSLVNKGLETSSLTESFLTFLKEIEGTTVQLLGGDCI